MAWRRSRAHYKQLSEFERDRIIGLKEAGWANWRIARHMGRSGAAIRRCWKEWVDSGRFQSHDGSGRPKATADQKDRLTVRSAVTALDSSLSTIRHAIHTRWSFISPKAPNHGGLLEAGVKAVKYHLRRVMGNLRFTYEEFLPIFNQIEGVLNSRRQYPLSCNPDDFEALTPSHFLASRPIKAIAESSLIEVSDNRARGLLMTNLAVLNHGQVTWTTPELAPLLLTTTAHHGRMFQLSTDLTCIAALHGCGLDSTGHGQKKESSKRNEILITLIERECTMRYDRALRHTSSVECLETFRSIFAVTLPLVRSNS
ncbi:HTH_Tnp_Tc3_2 domain-containing protein [Trichonephila clavipes]|nr:HTH_Tnp_Tc3_2 domain-containing protein [Trichonephila clavipes]